MSYSNVYRKVYDGITLNEWSDEARRAAAEARRRKTGGPVMEAINKTGIAAGITGLGVGIARTGLLGSRAKSFAKAAGRATVKVASKINPNLGEHVRTVGDLAKLGARTAKYAGQEVAQGLRKPVVGKIGKFAQKIGIKAKTPGLAARIKTTAKGMKETLKRSGIRALEETTDDVLMRDAREAAELASRPKSFKR